MFDFIGYCVVTLLGILAVFAFIAGIQKQLDIQERTYYDKELGRTVYIEKGV